MTNQPRFGLWATIRYRDGEMGLAWLKALGFLEHAVYRNDTNSTEIEHAEMIWPAGGGIMFGTYRSENEAWPQPPGVASMYLVTDDPDGLNAAALAAGGSEMEPVTDKDYGGRGGALRDPEGNMWSFGSYDPL